VDLNDGKTVDAKGQKIVRGKELTGIAKQSGKALSEDGTDNQYAWVSNLEG